MFILYHYFPILLYNHVLFIQVKRIIYQFNFHVEYLLYTRHCSGHCSLAVEKTDGISALMQHTF